MGQGMMSLTLIMGSEWTHYCSIIWYISKSIYHYDKRLIAWEFLIEKGLYFDLLKKSMMLLYDVSWLRYTINTENY